MSTPLLVRMNSGFIWLALSSTTVKPSPLTSSLVAVDAFADMNALVLFVIGVTLRLRFASTTYTPISLPFSFSASRSDLSASFSPESCGMDDLKSARS